MVRISLMASRFSALDRRDFLTGLGAAGLLSSPARDAFAQANATLLAAGPDTLALRPGQADTPVEQLATSDATLRFKYGTEAKIALKNGLPHPIVPDWRGIDGAAAIEPLIAQAPIPPDATANLVLPALRAGTSLCDLRLLEGGERPPSRSLPLVVEESAPVEVDRDTVFLVEDFRLRADGTAIAPGSDARDTAATVYTVNGRISPAIAVRRHERLRFRFINGFQRQVVGLKIENHDLRVMAMDGQPAEPFLARNGALVLAPGGRTDAFVDMTAPPGSISAIMLHDGVAARPVARLTISPDPAVRATPLGEAARLPANDLPAQLDLRSALRVDLAPASGDWVSPAAFDTSKPPAFEVRAGRTVVLALTNRGHSAAVFHLHGHHFRLLDRLDDGWKPYWLDTLAIAPGQTERIAFAAEFRGHWLLESFMTDWASPRSLRWYSVS